MFGVDDAVMAGLAGSAISGGLGLMGQSAQSQQAANAMTMAQQNFLLQRKAQQDQYELSTAGQTDARGNYTHYVPGRGWVTDVTPETKGLITSSDANQRNNAVTALTRGRMEQGQNFQRRQQEGGIAQSLLDQYKAGYGAPTREGVQGQQRLAGVTGANETADNMKSGIAAAALRSGGSLLPVANNFANINRGAVVGTRSAIANADAASPGIYEAQKQNYTKSMTEPYNLMATRASNITDTPFTPENVSAGVDSTRQAADAYGQNSMSKAIGGPAAGINSILAASMQQKVPNYDLFAGGMTENIKNILKGMGKNGTINSMSQDDPNYWNYGGTPSPQGKEMF